MALNVDCPACGDGLEVAEEYRDWTVRCPSCRHEFVAAGPAPVRPLGSRRSRRDRHEDDRDRIDDARALVAGPASWLRGYGMLQVVFGAIGAVTAVALGMWIAENPARAKRDLNAPNLEELILNVVIIGVASVCAVVCGALTARGAGKMARLESHGWGIASAVLALGSLMYCTCGLFVGLPIGIWALIALNKTEVQEGFAAARRRDRHEYEEDD
ncbi:MAG TPA: hypothetical protein VKE74_08835 [Gemmataceae bacterium]|nr:hypothetical protein [Gemmataceae bacterium]